MLVHCIGAEGFTNQIDRIREGFSQLPNIQLTNRLPEADLIYVNNPWFDHFEKSLAIKQGAKKIFNVLDIPEHLFPDYPLEKLQRQLSMADKVTCISNTVAKQIKKYCNIDATVIYNPCKDVSFSYIKSHRYKYLYVGRANDRNKRFYLIEQAFYKLGLSPKDLAVCGSENPFFGDYLGVVSDEKLNDLYNSVDFVFLPSKFEGIGLSMIEGAICGAIPIVTNDNLTAKEFFPDGRYDEVDPTPESIAQFLKKFTDSNFKNDFQEEIFSIGQSDFKNRFNKRQVAKNILDVYHSL